MKQLALVSTGMCTGVGFTAAATCAAVRCAIDNFAETRFIDRGGQLIIGSSVPLERPCQGLSKLAHLAVLAIQDCFKSNSVADTARTPLLLCVAERGRPGRPEGLEEQLFSEIQRELKAQFHEDSAVIPAGSTSVVFALSLARQLLGDRAQQCLIVGVDSLLVGATLGSFEEKARLLTSTNSNGFIPGEGAAAILVTAIPKASEPVFLCLGVGTARETATIESDAPLRAEGLTRAVKLALVESGLSMESVDYRLTDTTGEQYGFKEGALVVSRLLRTRKGQFPVWHPADCIGHVGAAIGPCALGIALAAAFKGYAPGAGVLCHFGTDDGTRSAAILRYEERMQ